MHSQAWERTTSLRPRLESLKLCMFGLGTRSASLPQGSIPVFPAQNKHTLVCDCLQNAVAVNAQSFSLLSIIDITTLNPHAQALSSLNTSGESGEAKAH